MVARDEEPAMHLSPYQVTAFTIAAREKSFSRAAEVLGVSQPSITQHVANLENRLGTQLFIRRRQGLELTQAAQELFEISDRLKTLEQILVEKVSDFRSLAAGHLRIVATSPRPALPAIARYRELHPEVQFEFALFDRQAAIRKVRDREVDVAIVTEPGAADNLRVTEVANIPYRAFFRADHRFAGRERLSLHDLQEELIVLPEEGSLLQRIVREKTTEAGIAFGSILKVTSYPVVIQAILHGLGIGLMLVDSIWPSPEIVTASIDEMPETYRKCIVTTPDKYDLRLVRSFVDVAVSEPL